MQLVEGCAYQGKQVIDAVVPVFTPGIVRLGGKGARLSRLRAQLASRPSRAASSPVCISFTREISSAGQSVARTRSSRAKGGSGEFSCPMHTQWSDHAHVEDGVPGQGRS